MTPPMPMKDDYSEELWTKLHSLRLTSALNQSVVEQRLPFGMSRKLKPLLQTGDSLKILRAADFLVDMKDPYTERRNLPPRDVAREKRDVIPGSFKKHILPKLHDLEPNQRYKFIQHKLISACDSCVIVDDDAKMLKFDPTAMLFFKESGELVKTNLTSNANGTVSNDKSQLGSILTQGCWLISLNDLLMNCSSAAQLPQVQNNKLRCMKYAEFLAQEGAELSNFGNEVEFVALNAPNTILMSRRRGKDTQMELFLVDKKGNVKFSSRAMDRRFNEPIYKQTIDLENGDLIILMRGTRLDLDKIVRTVSKCTLDQDFEDELLKIKDRPTALLVSRVHYAKEFDEAFAADGLRIKYVSHLDSKIGMVVNHPCPGPFGCTTRHSAVYRDGYFAALHHDASKINRFTDTINYIIRKLGNPVNLGKRLEQEGEECILKRISDVQYFAYVLRLRSGKFVLGLGGGAKCVVLSGGLRDVCVYEVPILMELPKVEPCDQMILLSPHFPPTELIKTIKAASVQEWMKELMKMSSVDLFSFKVSLIHIEFHE